MIFGNYYHGNQKSSYKSLKLQVEITLTTFALSVKDSLVLQHHACDLIIVELFPVSFVLVLDYLCQACGLYSVSKHSKH